MDTRTGIYRSEIDVKKERETMSAEEHQNTDALPVRSKRTIWVRTAGSYIAVAVAVHNSFKDPLSPPSWIEWLCLFGYLLLFWFPRGKTYSLRGIALISLVIALMHTLNVTVFHSGYWNVTLQLILVGFMASRTGERYIPWIAGGIVAEMVLLSFMFPVSLENRMWNLVSIAGVYFGVRGLVERNEFHRRTRRHLEALQQAHAELQEAAVVSMHHAVLEERSRIARDIHDSLGHSLTSLIVQLQAVQYMVANGPDEAREAVKNMLAVARQSLQDIRTSVHALADDGPSIGLDSLRALVSQTQIHTGLQCRFQVDERLELPSGVLIALYRILQEALTNITKHAEAASVHVELHKREDGVYMEIADNGKLAQAGELQLGFGMQGMKQRAAALGGSCEWTAGQPSGLKIKVQIPLTVEEESRDGGTAAEHTHPAR
ncbi:sensor histidine kinase [Paenibacillus thalictri]|uniref:histidine kinase n=1 Tax=Paenibacillus thalictri TaxID=2527873 RepID=A0A4Q9DLR0_9BACL|nr:sensor histidine kinase [Paenibacillus thalictri]TBL76087.1 sensor histidine kinase [Paenibacillus thalictri]